METAMETMGTVQHPQYLTFVIGGEEYAVGVLRVREIIQYHSVTRVPRTPEWVRGVINLRGTVVPVVDLAVKFGLPPATTTRSTCIVLTEVRLDGEPVIMGILTDAVRQVVDLPAEAVQPAPSFGTRVKVEYLAGMARPDGHERLLLLLDADRVLTTDEIVAATQEAVPAAPEALAS